VFAGLNIIHRPARCHHKTGTAGPDFLGMQVRGINNHCVSGLPRTFSTNARKGKRRRAKARRKASALPTAFFGGSNSGGGGGFDGVGGGVTGVAGHVGGSGGMTRGTRCGAGRPFIRVAGGGVGGNCGCARLAAFNFALRPGASCFNGFARPIISRVFLLEERKHMPGAAGGPERKRPLILLVEMPGRLPGFWLCGCSHNRACAMRLGQHGSL
jgi:hypothetical protein